MSKLYKISFEEVAEVEPIQDEATVELNNQRIELEQDSKEIDRQCELVEGLEALKMIAERIGTPSPTEVGLFRVVANMAVVGTEKRAQDFLPAMESNKPIALEGFGTKIMDMIKAIIAKLKEWWIKFKNFIKSFFISTKKDKEKLEKDLKEFNDSFKDHNENNTNKDIEISKYLLILPQTKNEYIKIEEIEKNIEEYKKLGILLNKVFEDHEKLVKDFLHDIKLNTNDGTDEREKYELLSNSILEKFEREIVNKEVLGCYTLEFQSTPNNSKIISFKSHFVEKDIKLNISKESLSSFFRKLNLDDIAKFNKDYDYEEILLDKSVFIGTEETNIYRIKNIKRVLNNYEYLLMNKVSYGSTIRKVFKELDELIENFKRR